MTTETTRQQPIEIELMEPVPDKPGYVRVRARRPIGEVLRELNAKLEVEGMLPDEYGFGASFSPTPPHDRITAEPWPEWRWIAVYAVTGGSEGHYIHIDAIGREGQRTSIALAKTFEGWERAGAIAGAAGRLLGA